MALQASLYAAPSKAPPQTEAESMYIVAKSTDYKTSNHQNLRLYSKGSYQL